MRERQRDILKYLWPRSTPDVPLARLGWKLFLRKGFCGLPFRVFAVLKVWFARVSRDPLRRVDRLDKLK